MKCVEIPSKLEAARAVEEEILNGVAAAGYDDSDGFAVRLALEEAVNNAIKHGNRGNAAKRVRIGYEVTADRICFQVSDEGAGFDPLGVSDPTADENLENPSGRGIMLMKAYMDEVQYNPRGNEVRLVKLKRKA